MSVSIRRGLAALFAGALLMFLLPASASAVIDGGCTGEGHSTSSSVDLTTDEVWHVKSGDVAGGSGSAPGNMTRASVGAYALGFVIPIVNSSGDGDTTGSIDDISLDTFSKLGRVFVVAGSASGDATCNGQILIIIDDVDAIFTVLGGGGLIVFILALAAMLMTGRGGGCLSKIFAFVFGAIAATGLGLSLEQFQVISPTTPVGLVIVLAGAILGFVVALRLGPPGMPKPPAEPAVASAIGSSGGAEAAMNAPSGEAPDLAPGPDVAGAIGSSPDDVAKGAMDLVNGDVPPPPAPGEPAPMDYGEPPDPNAPGVDVAEEPPGGTGGGSAN